MGFWNTIWHGIKTAGKVVVDVGRAGYNVAKATMDGISAGTPFFGPEFGGVIGGIVGGVTAGIDNIHGLINRLPYYEVEFTNPDGSGNAKAVADSVKPLRPVLAMQNSMSALTRDAPPSVVEAARVGARFFDGVRKHGDVVAAAKLAGATPISKHLGNSISRAIIGEVGARTGFHADRHMLLHNPATVAANMLPETSAFRSRVNDVLHHGGAESVAVKHLAQRVANPVPAQMVIGGV